MTLSTVRRDAVELLCAAQADGRISVELFESRLAAVHQATTDSSVLAIVADLIDETPHGGVSAYEPPPPVVPFAERLRLSAVLGSTRREGNWVVPYHLELLTVLGEAHFDFREAILPDELIDVHVSVTLGSLVLVVPRGTVIEHSGVEAILASTEVKRKGKALVPATGLTLRVTGNLLLGSLEIHEK